MSKIRPAAMAFALMIGFAHAANAQTVSSDVVRNLGSDDESTRIRTFNRLLLPATGGAADPARYSESVERLASRTRNDNALATALIALLDREGLQLRTAPAGSKSEDYMAYYGDLINVVSRLKDARAARGLVEALPTGKMATDGVIDIGDAAVPALLPALKSADVGMRRSAAFAVGELAARRAASLRQSSKTSMRAALLDALADQEGTVRLQVVKSLNEFPDRDVQAAIQQLAEKDPFTMGRPDQLIYPVREAAKTWIRKNGPQISK